MSWRSFATAEPSSSCVFPAFAPVVSDAFELLKGLPDGVEIVSGETILEQSREPTSIYLLRKGLVKLVSLTPEGREMVLGLRATGWYAGAVSALTHSPIIYSVKTVTPCIVSIIPASEFPMRLMQSARMSRHFTDTLCNEINAHSAEARIKSGSAEQRLAQFMLERDIQHSQVKTLDTLPHLKQLELAQLLAITPEHLSRLLHKGDEHRVRTKPLGQPS
jgi:CRP-like cAMP-binding protein